MLTDHGNGTLTERPRFSPPRLRSRRTDARMTRAVLAVRADLSAETIAALERGRAVPSERALGRLARVLGCTPADLCAHDDPPSPFWNGVCAALPPLTDDEVREIGAVLHRIEDRRAGAA